MADGSFSIQVLIQVSLIKRMRKFSQALSCQAVCSIGFLWDHGPCMLKLKVKEQSLCLLQVCVPNDVNDTPQARECTIFFGDFNVHIGTVNKHGKALLIGMETQQKLRTAGIYCSLVVTTSFALRTHFSNIMIFASRYGTDLVSCRSLFDRHFIVLSDLFSEVLDV